MLKYNNTHIFTGYLKQLLSTVNLPTCKIYTREFTEYLEKHGKEDPRVLRSFDNISEERLAVRVNYLKNDEVYNYFWKNPTQLTDLQNINAAWKKSANVYYSKNKFIPGLTHTLSSPGITYDAKTHEYLGEYLRFLRDYHNINLMSLYNCFTDKIYNNVYFPFMLSNQVKITIDAQEPEYRLYALPVKLFAKYTIAIDCDQGIEMFCGLYNTSIDTSAKAQDLAARTYQKVYKTLFRQPFLYDKLDTAHWSDDTDLVATTQEDVTKYNIRTNKFTRWDLTNRENDLKLFIKIPVSCKSSITILEGDFRSFNDVKYAANDRVWNYKYNHNVLNFAVKDKKALNEQSFTPISQLQLLAFNTGESYPFADRLIEYLSGSAITSIDEIPDNIRRVQKVMNNNSYYFKIDGLWEDKMQKILYDYMMNSGPIVTDQPTKKLVDRREGRHPRLGYASKSSLYDILGYVDKDTEKLYASWKKSNDKAVVGESLQNVDIYNGLYNI